jgi:type 1 glutamine amidotransferase
MGILKTVALGALSFSVLTAQAPQQSPRKRVLAVGASVGWHHDSVSDALATVWKLGRETGLWDTFIKTDTELLTKKKLEGNAKNLDHFDAVFFYTTGELPMDAEQKAALLSFVREDGKGFIGTHSATDTLYEWPEYGEMIGGYFDRHPWHQKVGVIVEDRSHPATRHFSKRIEVHDEIYQFRNWSRDRVRVLMSLDVSTVDLTKEDVRRTDKDFGITWARDYGKGRVFYSALGHRNELWDRPDIQKMWTEAMKWVLQLN